MRHSLLSRLLFDLGATRFQKLCVILGILACVYTLTRYRPKWREPLFSGGRGRAAQPPPRRTANRAARGGNPKKKKR